MKMYRIRKDDKVMVIAGKDAGKINKVLKILRKRSRACGEKRLTWSNATCVPTTPYANGHLAVSWKMPIHVSNLMVVCSACGKALEWVTRPSSLRGKEKKVRFCKKRCNEVME